VAGTNLLRAHCRSVTTYFFDFAANGTTSIDEEDVELPDVETVHDQALQALTEAARGAVVEGAMGPRFSVHLRGEAGPVLEVTAVFVSKIFRKQ